MRFVWGLEARKWLYRKKLNNIYLMTCVCVFVVFGWTAMTKTKEQTSGRKPHQQYQPIANPLTHTHTILVRRKILFGFGIMFSSLSICLIRISSNVPSSSHRMPRAKKIYFTFIFACSFRLFVLVVRTHFVLNFYIFSWKWIRRSSTKN